MISILSDLLDRMERAPLGYASVFVVLIVVIFAIQKITTRTDIPYIRNLPEIPGALPISGHLLELGDDHATVCEKWWRKYGHSVFQIRLGNTRAVVVNSFADCRKMLVSNSQALIDRPKLYTFHGVISSTQGFTIGSSPWDDSCRNKRKAASTTLNKSMMKTYFPMFDLESYCIVRDLHRDANPGPKGIEVSIRPFIQRYALNTTLTLCYGIRMDAVYDSLLREILYVGSAISLLRSASENFQDYIPILRYLPNNEKNKRSKELRQRRDAYLDLLLNKVREMIKKGTDKPCISAAILRDQETRLTGVEVGSICLSLVSGGFETIPGTLVSCIGSLSEPAGQAFQEKAYQAIKGKYGGNMKEAWAADFEKEDVEYLTAIVKEAGRYYTVSNMSLPRKTVSEVRWGQAVIPKGTMVLINAQAGNHDVDRWGPDAGVFNPERWLNQTPEKGGRGAEHLSFGAGSRSCPGNIIASKLIYSALFRLLSLYKIEASETEPPNTDYVDYNAIKSALVAIPRDFKIRLIPRDAGLAQEVLRMGEQRTGDFYKE